MRLLLCAALSAALLIAAAGCGSDDEPGSTTAAQRDPTPTTVRTGTTAQRTTAPSSAASAKRRAARHEALVAKASKICRDYNRTLRAVQREIRKIGSVGNVDLYAPAARRAAKAASRASARFDALRRLAEDESQAALVSKALQAQAKGNKLLLEAALADDIEQWAATNSAIEQTAPQYQAIMRGFGMTTVCGTAR